MTFREAVDQYRSAWVRWAGPGEGYAVPDWRKSERLAHGWVLRDRDGDVIRAIVDERVATEWVPERDEVGEMATATAGMEVAM